MFRPLASLRVAADEPLAAGRAWTLLRRPVQLALLFGAFVSFTTTGLLTLRLVLDGVVFWSFVPALNVALGLILSRLAPVRLGAARTVDLLFSTYGPWWLWVLGVTGLAVFLPSTSSAPWPQGLVPASLLVTMIWSGWIQLRLYRDALGIAPWPALLLVGGLKLAVWGVVAVWFGVTDQLEPRLPPLPEL